jgi:formylglycine-generating enzyme required for sulfatase activity
MSEVFISYARKDEAFVRQLAKALSDVGVNVWLDVEDIPAGMKWSSAIQQGLDTAELLILVITPESMESVNVEDEWQYFIDEKKPIIPVLLSEAKVHFQLRRLQYLSFANSNFEIAFRQLCDELERKGVSLKRNQSIPQLEREQHAAPLREASPIVELPPPPDVSGILPPPFEWCYVPAEKVTIEYSENEKRTIDVAPFYISKYPITNAQFAKFIYAGGYIKSNYWTLPGWHTKNTEQWSQPRYWHEDKWNGGNFPVVGVSCYEALAFSLWLNDYAREDEGEQFRLLLPTEEQWQRAAQGDNENTYPWGNKFDVKYCNTRESGFGRTTPVTQYPNGESQFHVIDMGGNVKEWCVTRYKINPPTLEVIDQALRGGSWNDSSYAARSVCRLDFNPNLRENDFGFRVVFKL